MSDRQERKGWGNDAPRLAGRWGRRIGRSLRRVQQQSARRLDRWLDQHRLRAHRRQWFLLTGPSPELELERLDLTGLNRLMPPADRFWADPLLCRSNGQHQLFFEELSEERGRGIIKTMALDASGRPLEPTPTTALEVPEHLSYPFLFRHGGELFMLPECGERNRLDLYGCVRFPDHWELAETLMVDARLKDCTLLRHEEHWWLFCATARGRMRVNETLVAFYAEQPLTDQWQAHAGNPILRDFTAARPGGRIQPDRRGRLLRPAQNAVPRYGYGLSIQEILTLTPEHYQERRLWQTTGPQQGWQGLHHIDWCEGMLALDAQRLIPKKSPETP